MLLERAPAERQSEPGPLTLRLGREERLEDPRLNLRGDAGPSVGHLDGDPSGLALHRGRNREPARRFQRAHRLDGVDHEVHDDLVDLVAVGPHNRQVVREGQHDRDVAGAQIVAEQLDGLLDDQIQPHVAPLGRLLTGQREEVPDDTRAPVRARENLFGALDQGGVLGPAAEQMSLPHHDRERIVELVGHAREQ